MGEERRQRGLDLDGVDYPHKVEGFKGDIPAYVDSDVAGEDRFVEVATRRVDLVLNQKQVDTLLELATPPNG
jgi:hypothetical protein